jgi:hypothetical protein
MTQQASPQTTAIVASGPDYRKTGEPPALGSLLVAKYPHRLLWATDDRKAIDIPAGTRFQIVRVEGGWDHTHAMVCSSYQFLFHLRILEGNSAGRLVRVASRGEVSRILDQEEPDSVLPPWLMTLPSPPVSR